MFASSDDMAIETSALAMVGLTAGAMAISVSYATIVPFASGSTRQQPLLSCR